MADFDAVSLKELDERAELLRRVDHKYASHDPYGRLLSRLGDDHEVLEIDGRRSFGYRTTYSETPDLRCFVDHVEDRLPRFKARNRLYEDSGECVFEIKLKRAQGETDKPQIDYSQADREHLTEATRGCIETALADAGLQAPDELNPSLTSSFDRVTLSARTGSERMTCDLGVRLIGAHGQTTRMHDDLELVETKSETGESPVAESSRRCRSRRSRSASTESDESGRRGTRVRRAARQRPV